MNTGYALGSTALFSTEILWVESTGPSGGTSSLKHCSGAMIINNNNYDDLHQRI